MAPPQGHIDSGCQQEALFVLERVACPGSRADSAVKTRYVVLCGLALATSQPWAQHDTGPDYSCAGSSCAPAVKLTITGLPDRRPADAGQFLQADGAAAG